MNIKKIIGWVLLILGLLIIFWGLYSSYNIFTAKTKAPEIFKTEVQDISPKTTTQKDKTKPLTPAALQEEMKKNIDEQIKEIIPSSFIPQLLNLISWSIFVGILIFGGGKLSGIGIRLIKE